MKVHELIEYLQNKDQNADVFMSFNGCTESGEMLNITNIDTVTFFREEDSENYVSSEEYSIPKDYAGNICTAINLYSNRCSYEPTLDEYVEG